MKIRLERGLAYVEAALTFARQRAAHDGRTLAELFQLALGAVDDAELASHGADMADLNLGVAPVPMFSAR